MYLLDTNALSELLKKWPKPQFLARLRQHPAETFFTSSICVMELRQGVADVRITRPSGSGSPTRSCPA
jgi:predicted nucleic acid-binding protein